MNAKDAGHPGGGAGHASPGSGREAHSDGPSAGPLSNPDPSAKKDSFLARVHAHQARSIDGLDYYSISRKLVMHEDLNAAGRLFGGRLMEWVDENVALFCMSQMGTRRIATKKISEVIFNQPADLGDVLEFLCRVKHVGKTSLTTECLVMTKLIAPTDKRKLIVQCDLVFVSLDADGRPTPHAYSRERSSAPDFEI